MTFLWPQGTGAGLSQGAARRPLMPPAQAAWGACPFIHRRAHHGPCRSAHPELLHQPPSPQPPFLFSPVTTPPLRSHPEGPAWLSCHSLGPQAPGPPPLPTCPMWVSVSWPLRMLSSVLAGSWCSSLPSRAWLGTRSKEIHMEEGWRVSRARTATSHRPLSARAGQAQRQSHFRITRGFFALKPSICIRQALGTVHSNLVTDKM